MAVPSEPLTPSPANGATGVSTGLTKLDWADCTDAAGYRVRIATASPPTYEIPVSAIISEAKLAPLSQYINLVSGTKYYWQVVALSSDPEEATSLSQIWSFTTDSRESGPIVTIMAAAMRRRR